MTATKETLKLAQEMQQFCKMADDKRDEGLPTQIPEVDRFDNLVYGENKEWHVLDIYRPKHYTGKLPTIINIHGGGWVYGTKETYQFYGLSLAKKDFAFVNITYQLPPLVEFPEELSDINKAVQWVVDHADEYDLDMENVFIVGDSAGGQMALQYATVLSNAEFGKLFNFDKPAIKVKAVALNCPATFIDLPNTIVGGPEAYFTQESREKYSELMLTERYLTKDCPPIFLMTATNDFIRDHAVRLDGYLMAKGIEHEFRIYGTLEDPREHVFHCNMRDELAKQCNEDELNFFRKYL